MRGAAVALGAPVLLGKAAHACALPCRRTRSQLEQQRLAEYLAALEGARKMGTIDESEFEAVRCRGGQVGRVR